jgi:hypothetical protein
MKILTFQRASYLAVALILTSVVVLVRPWKSSAIQTSGAAEFRLRLQDGLGSEIRFARPNASAEDVRAAVYSLGSFIYNRSGVEMSASLRDRLTIMESDVLNGSSRRVSVGELEGALTDTVLERLATLSDLEIESAAKSSLRTIPDLVHPNKADNVLLRANGSGGASLDSFISQAKAFRDRSKTPDESLRRIVSSAISHEVDARLRAFSAAIPAQWGDVWDSGIMPSQCFLIAYSVASDDLLCDSQLNLQKSMDTLNQRHIQKYGVGYSPAGRSAYGTKGYIYSSPLETIFNDLTVSRMLDRIRERGVR